MIMSAALGGYIKQLRVRQDLVQTDVQRRVESALGKKLDISRFWGVEAGERWPQGDFLTALIVVLRGSLDDMSWFIEHPDASAEDGAARADARLTSRERALICEIAQTPEGRQRVIRRVMELTEDPYLEARINGYLDGIDRDRRN